MSWAVVGPALAAVVVIGWFWGKRVSEGMRQWLLRTYLAKKHRPRAETWFGTGTIYGLNRFVLVGLLYLAVVIAVIVVADDGGPQAVLWIGLATAIAPLTVAFAGLRWDSTVVPDEYRDDANRRPLRAAASIGMVGEYAGIALLVVAALGMVLVAVQLTG